MTDDTTCECTFFDEGDWVESRLNHDIFGIVVSNSDFGRYVQVQLAGSLEIRPFHAVTLQHIGEPELPSPVSAEKPADNVVHVDFTKGRPLAPNSKTEGAA